MTTGGNRWIAFFLASVVVALLTACGASGDASISTQQAHSRLQEGPCPTGGLSALPNRNQQARNQLVPAGAARMQFCRYQESLGPKTGQQSAEVAERTVDVARDVRRLSALFDALPAAPRGPRSCAEPTRRLHYLVVVRYREAPTVYVRIVFAGCSYVKNGVSRTTYLPSRKLRQDLQGLFG